jgi:hypothetical protein
MNRAFLLVGIPGIVVATAYIGVFYGWRPGIVAACIGAGIIAVAAWSIHRNRTASSR